MENYPNFTLWSMRISILVALIVALLSWINGLKIFNLIVRAGISFGIIYLLLMGTFSLFKKTALSIPKQDQTLETGRGGLVDVSLGGDDFFDTLPQNSGVPGQVDKDLSLGLDSKKQADIIRRMGWGGEET
ncbi:hypothetical protein Desaci_3806 [Desulfosporosinus acidiphilus SJ4]|uniref:Uncharacterized protein n=1 Tax=Desulfosporosinus acidiphilus (strain DSM 22704 / JCM 16185 / SJ4) TaxID=646529 RepID=I4DA63_DESAJ|nr:hypothetical protein [Desulfosporosinus acidiphilus]AFM42687.1 hypothetical protein Desaci_3806 [Desulfosporosinus acidiphilus SJ4]